MMESKNPITDEPSECAAIKRNLRYLSQRRLDLIRERDSARAEIDRLQRQLEQAQVTELQLKRKLAQAKRDRNRPPGRRSRLEQAQVAAELAAEVAEALVENLLGDAARQRRDAQRELDQARNALADAERRWRDADQAVLLNEQRFEEFGCRGRPINYLRWG